MRGRPRLILIVGLQKSGTTLLQRLLLETGLISKPFRAEGDEFWGQVPPFSPSEFPAGTIYQRDAGARGHELSADDATPDIVAEMHERWCQLESSAGVVLNKCPYNTVRVPWIRAIFPEALIVAMVRRPVPNVFSLVKKFTPHEQSGEPPEDGWWGVKPASWRQLISDDKIDQSAMQWRDVNRSLYTHKDAVDLMFSYHGLCGRPGEVVRAVFEHAGIEHDGRQIALPPLKCFDLEYKRGAPLRSRNRMYHEHGLAGASQDDPVEQHPLSEHQVSRIREICDSTIALFPEVR